MVQKLIRDVQLNVVAVELCEARSKSWILTNSKSEKYKFWEIFGIPRVSGTESHHLYNDNHVCHFAVQGYQTRLRGINIVMRVLPRIW